MDPADGAFQCMLEEYKQCKSEIQLLEKIHWRVQFLFIPTILITLVGFYLKDVWSSSVLTPKSVSTVLFELWSDEGIIVLVLWFSAISILTQLHITNFISRLGRHIRESLAPEIERLLNISNVFAWERGQDPTQRLATRVHSKHQSVLSAILGGIFSILPIAVSFLCVFQGLFLFSGMYSIIKVLFIVGTSLSLFGAITQLAGFLTVSSSKQKKIVT